MIVLLQKVKYAKVEVAGVTVGAIDHGLLVFLAVEKNDTELQAQRLVERVLGYRLFEDEQRKMNLSVREVAGGVLVVSQFTLAADTKKGMRPSFTPAAEPVLGEKLYDYFVDLMKAQYSPVATGIFGAYMEVSLCNDGPVTVTLQADKQCQTGINFKK